MPTSFGPASSARASTSASLSAKSHNSATRRARPGSAWWRSALMKVCSTQVPANPRTAERLVLEELRRQRRDELANRTECTIERVAACSHSSSAITSSCSAAIAWVSRVDALRSLSSTASGFSDSGSRSPVLSVDRSREQAVVRPEQIAAARDLAAGAGLTIETQRESASFAMPMAIATTAGALLALAILAKTVGLIPARAQAISAP
jgi:hypothetical protein